MKIIKLVLSLLTQGLIKWLPVILFELATYTTLHAQGVGIGTANPQATLHVAGTLRVDSVKKISTITNVLVLDTGNRIASFSVDSLPFLMSAPGSDTIPFFFKEVAQQASTTSSVPQSRVTLTLPPGGYIILAYAEVFNTGATAGVRVWLFEGSTELSYGAPYSNTTTYGSWSTLEFVSPVQVTAYTLSWSSWPSGTTSYIRRARIVAMRVF